MNESLKEELEVLESIYPEEYQGYQQHDSFICITVCNEEKKWKISFEISENYPNQVDGMRIEIYQANHTRRKDLEELSHQIYANHFGEVCMFTIIEEVRPLLETAINDEDIIEKMNETCDFDGSVELDETVDSINDCNLSVIHGPITTEMRSSFQSHLAEVHSMKDVEVFRALVLSNRKIARATHNIFAYRFYDENTKVLHQGCDDDGETAAGGRVAEMMRLMEVQNVAVIVTRWFGGILLGPNRFKYICNSAKDLLESCGYVDHRKSLDPVQQISNHDKNTNHKSISKKKH